MVKKERETNWVRERNNMSTNLVAEYKILEAVSRPQRLPSVHLKFPPWLEEEERLVTQNKAWEGKIFLSLVFVCHSSSKLNVIFLFSTYGRPFKCNPPFPPFYLSRKFCCSKFETQLPPKVQKQKWDFLTLSFCEIRRGLRGPRHGRGRGRSRLKIVLFNLKVWNRFQEMKFYFLKEKATLASLGPKKF